MIRAVLFDIDGTLVDSNEFHVLAWQRAFESHGVPLALDVIRSQIGKGSDQLIPALAPHFAEELQHVIAEAHDRVFKQEYLPRIVPFPGAVELLRRLHSQGKTLVLASSAGQADVQHYVKLLNAESLLAATTSTNDVKQSKPAADIFASSLAKIVPIPAHETVAVGDTPYDVISAGKCEIATIAVRSGGFSDETLSEAGAIAIYDDVAALLAGVATSPLA